MYIDAFTVLFSGFLVKVVLGVLFLVLWLRGSKRAKWFAWWSATFLFGMFASLVFVLRGPQPQFSAIGIAAASIIAAMVCCWQGVRVFERRKPLWDVAIGLPALWLGLCLFPAFVTNTAYRVVVSSMILATVAGLTVFELWRGRAERLPSRWPIMAVFASFGLIFAIRIPLVGWAPFPFGATMGDPSYTAVFNLVMFFHTIVLAVLLVALSKERQEFEQRVRAQTDPLTGALNRRAFMSRGRRLVLRHQKARQPLCLLFLDLDRFKALNDQYGHSGGDDVLTAFVNVVHDNIRPTDFLFRIGGEEFCCLLPATRCVDAATVAERIRKQLADTSVDAAGDVICATVSIGIATTEIFGYDIDTLLRRADAAVYIAKRAGRNRVAVAAQDEAADGLSPIGAAALAAE